MKLSHLIIATSLTAASFATFAAPQQAPAQEDKVVVSTQEKAETTDLSANAPASEASAEQPNQEKAAK
ncbi:MULTISPECIES: hypothetical protein [Acinetobacter]|jgi:hypothetical protein|uniref:hypothetical protein n=1 Tax=Acinetobacter TaxID=469 RepID=UPI000994E112|nr:MULTISPECIES: hypothetical protein [Acinetobacter]MDH1365495.1 hypothetical protein [Acinetobacter johnsonii]MDH1698903.1 hypothetical protein [Acinetobacter johnsonii]MDH2047503.1 hypothetical protein [Acinetobacter johnsonii]OOW11248.1 hypothetical protein MF4642_04325 [Acinetobacter sp. MF4642]QQT94424.1 hypothetical protein I6I51_06865 [Acinetobacter johnsonii]